jgi:hypothetical protein
MEQSPWEANRFAASQELPCLLWNQVYYSIHKCQPPVPIHASSIQSIPPLLKIYLNIILPSMPGSPSLQAPPTPIRSTCSAHLILLCLITQTILGEYRSLSSSACSFLHSHYLLPLRPKYSEHPQPMFLSHYQWSRVAPIQNRRQKYSSVYHV